MPTNSARSGGARGCRPVGARAADHLIFVDESDADALAAADVCAVLLPIAALYLKLGRYAPARMLIDRGVAVALGTDLNPGGGSLAVDAVRDDARLLRDGDDAGGSARRGHAQRGMVARSRRTPSAAWNRAS